MALSHRRWPFPASSLLERYWPGIHGYSWSIARVAGLLPVILVCGIMAAAYFVCVPVSLVPLLSTHFNLAVVMLAVFHYIYFNVLINYALLVWADPGRVPADWKRLPPVSPRNVPHQRGRQLETLAGNSEVADYAADDFEDLAIQQHPLVNRRHEQSSDGSPDEGREFLEGFKYYHLMQERAYDGGWRYCRKCNQMKPDRSHHCSVCGVCILRMDHHCVFIGTCKYRCMCQK